MKGWTLVRSTAASGDRFDPEGPCITLPALTNLIRALYLTHPVAMKERDVAPLEVRTLAATTSEPCPRAEAVARVAPSIVGGLGPVDEELGSQPA